MTVPIRQASVADVDLVAPLFDAYRQFYRQPADLPRARRFLAERLSQRQSTVLVAEAMDGVALGFVQLYQCFSSIRAAPVFILSDLFVGPSARGAGVGRLLMEAAVRFARATGAVGLELATARTNAPAQRLYESLGWQRDEVFYQYGLDL
ncbi:MAG TPA: GNAT family N-acetyltransferase [Steroidobacteraceae bacterium]|nr:GNAT family N-acetyltransferase [Steroidobacteraceae bacterium]